MLSPAIISGAFLGWALGANDAANVFGTAVQTRVIKYWHAVIITSVFVILGALIDGHRGVNKLSDYAFSNGVNTPAIAFIVMLAAGITMTLMTVLKLPVSASQSVIGSILGIGVVFGKADFSATNKFFSAWIITPLGSLIIGFILYKVIEKYAENWIQNLVIYDYVIKIGYITSGIFSSYSLGANNVANVTSIYAGQINILSVQQAVLIGGLSIALGVMTFSKPVMITVGSSIAQLSPVSGFISVIAAAITVYIYALIGIPVSTSQAIVGAVVGIGLVKGVKSVNMKVLRNILFAWFGTPTVAGLISYISCSVYKYLLTLS